MRLETLIREEDIVCPSLPNEKQEQFKSQEQCGKVNCKERARALWKETVPEGTQAAAAAETMLSPGKGASSSNFLMGQMSSALLITLKSLQIGFPFGLQGQHSKRDLTQCWKDEIMSLISGNPISVPHAYTASCYSYTRKFGPILQPRSFANPCFVLDFSPSAAQHQHLSLLNFFIVISYPPSKLLLITFGSNPALQGICNLEFCCHALYVPSFSC